MKRIRRIAAVLAAAAIAFTLASPAAEAAGEQTDARKDVCVFVDGELYPGDAFLAGGTTYVSLRRFIARFKGARISWNEAERTAAVMASGHTVVARDGAGYLEVDGWRVKCSGAIFVRCGRIYVPLRAIAAAFGYSTAWIEGANVALLSKDTDGYPSADGPDEEESLYWLSRIIAAEARGEPFEGKLAVGTVIMNRVASDEYPDTIWGVVFDRENGVQFTPTANGTVFCEPDGDSVRAAKLCLCGYRTSKDILFFMNERLAESSWIKNNCVFVVSIGNHDFYA